MNNTTKMNNKMIAAILFGEFGWNFVFVNPKTKEYCKNESATIAWLNKNGINVGDFTNHCWNMYDMCKRGGINCGLVSFFDKDDETIYNLTHSIDVNKFYDEAFNF